MKMITLTTDFGLQDWFVGAMKGVLLGIQPKAQIVDITHEIPPGNLSAGAFVLAAAFRSFPPATVHVAVVDPGVGSARAAIAIQTENYLFVGPDNGVLSLAVEQDRVESICRLTNRKFFLEEISPTFHGRDVFAPVAAHLSRGVSLHEMGPTVPDYQRLGLPVPKIAPGRVIGAVLYIDRFGNAITNIDRSHLLQADTEHVRIRVRGRKAPLPVCAFYQAVEEGQFLAIFGSTGLLEIALNGGNASRKLALRIGHPVVVEY